ncbi:MAG: alpha/beta fold hydrolase [Cyanobacteria bacterium P01_F01_bin.150]
MYSDTTDYPLLTFKSFANHITLAIAGAMTSMLSLSFAVPVKAAERIYFDYGILGIAIPRQDLDIFAETGAISSSLKPILSRMDDRSQAQLQDILLARYDVDPVLANRFSYTRSGQHVLETIGEVVQTESGQNGFYALRAALTLAAADEDGLTILNFLQHLPTDIRVDVAQGLAIAREFSSLLADTEAAMDGLASANHAPGDASTKHPTAISAGSTVSPGLNFTDLPDPRQPGDGLSSMQTLQLYDEERDRPINLDIYTPRLTTPNTSQQIPVIVVSNGLGARRSRFDELAIHLASYGFAVVMLDHPGSDRQRLQEFYQGLHTENFEATEFIDRPLDISFVLDELTRLNGAQFNRQLDLNNVGMFGYSFGGTTALALAGAKIDRDHLQQACANESSLFNISLLYQCRALELAPTILDDQILRDPRIQATYVYVPFSHSLYGPKGLALVEGPVFWEATEQDILTPLVIEQLPAFSWITNISDSADCDTDHRIGDRYLVVSEGLPHARLTLDVVNRLTNQSVAWEDIKPITETYHQMLTTIFFQVHLAQDQTYRPYLRAEGTDYLAQESYPLHWQQCDYDYIRSRKLAQTPKR